jgi:hypothetical protein
MMSNRLSKGRLGLAAGALALVFALAVSAASAAEPESVTFTVTATAKKGSDVPAVTKSDVQFFLEKKPTQVAGWKRGEKLYVAVLIDDSLDNNVANQWNDLKEFFNAMPATTLISVCYARNGTAMVAQDFTNDHALAAKALRLPLGNQGTFSSPYLAVQDLIKRWPASSSDDRRSILMISSGIDYFRGNFEPITPDMDTTVEYAQKQNINVWSIYAPDARHRSRGAFLSFRGQMNLSELAEETGGESYYLGTAPLVSFKPYLDELMAHLNDQYLLTFVGDGGPKGRFERVHETTELSNVELFSATRAFLPPVK